MFKKEIRLPTLNEFCIKSLFQKDFQTYLPNTLEFNETQLGISKCFTIHDLVHRIGKCSHYSNFDTSYLEQIFSKILNNWLDYNWVDCMDIKLETGKKVTIYWCIYNNIDFEDPNTPYINRKTYSILSNSGGPQNNPNKRKASDLLFDTRRRLSIKTSTNYTKPIKFFNITTAEPRVAKPPSAFNFICIETYSILQVKHELLKLQKQLTKWKAFSQIKTMDKIESMKQLQSKWENHINQIIVEFYKVYREREIKFSKGREPLKFEMFLKKLKFNSKWFRVGELEKSLLQ